MLDEKTYYVTIRVQGAPAPVWRSPWLTKEQARRVLTQKRGEVARAGWTHEVEAYYRTGAVVTHQMDDGERPTIYVEPWTPEAPTGLWAVRADPHPLGDPDTGVLAFGWRDGTVVDPSGRLTDRQMRAAQQIGDSGVIDVAISDWR